MIEKGNDYLIAGRPREAKFHFKQARAALELNDHPRITCGSALIRVCIGLAICELQVAYAKKKAERVDLAQRRMRQAYQIALESQDPRDIQKVRLEMVRIQVARAELQSQNMTIEEGMATGIVQDIQGIIEELGVLSGDGYNVRVIVKRAQVLKQGLVEKRIC